ncbi:hypothetical protein QSV34_05095 [Porticoccus sp. W117]|uniref:hypothetical protein n=1 Tax=Porticoccus sp. W117 TaxID=3054777 RepID=UPI002593A4B0|nr:hypothetical protein [Porticoccus sp. W117]MDM3870724.1 hypothetical protein [Porticoccus sp. W117]
MATKTHKNWLVPLFAASALLLSACSTNVTVTGDYPSPLAKPIPYDVGIVFDDAFKDYVFTRDNIEIKLGDAQTRMYSNLFSGMFANSTLLESREAATPDIDLVIVPNVEEIQIATPKDNRLKVYEVWIKYNMQVYDGDGSSIADWLMTCYGKTPTATLKSSARSLNLASVVALRDAGARMTTGFVRVPEVQGWLIRQAARKRQQPAPATSDTPAASEPQTQTTVEGNHERG